MKRDQQKAAIIGILGAGATRQAAAAAAGVPRRTFYYWLTNDEDFATAVAGAERVAVSCVEGALFRAAKQVAHDPRYQRSAIFFLKCRGGWKERQVIEHEHTTTREQALDELTAALDRVAAGRRDQAVIGNGAA